MISKLTLFLLLMFHGIVLSQSSSDIEKLLLRLDALPDSILPFHMAIQEHFTPDEQAMLYTHFNQRNFSTKESESFNNSSVDNFYVMNVFALSGSFGNLSSTAPYNYTEIASYPTKLYFSADFDDTGTLYALNWDNVGGNNTLDILDPQTGSPTEVGPLTGIINGHVPSGLAWDYTSGTMYVLSSPVSSLSTQLYTIDLSTGHLTTIGGMFPAGGLWLEISNDGVAYTTDVVNDILYEIDLTTGLLTGIGPLGINILFAQDASFDHSTNTLYMAGYLGSTQGGGGIYEVDRTTGNTTNLGSTPVNLQFSGFAIPEPPLASIEDNYKEHISVYPVPARDYVNVSSSNSNEIKSILVYDTMGRDVKLKFMNEQIDVSNLAQGVYFIHLETTRGKVIKRILKN